MLDIIEVTDGNDLTVLNSVVSKAGNVLSVQIGALEYATSFGIDFKFFLNSDLQFQNESFKAYLIQRLTENQINVSQVLDIIETLSKRLTFYVGDVKTNQGGLIL